MKCVFCSLISGKEKMQSKKYPFFAAERDKKLYERKKNESGKV